MKRHTFTVTIDHEDSLFPDEGALLRHLNDVLFSRRAWFTANKPGVMCVYVIEESPLDDLHVDNCVCTLHESDLHCLALREKAESELQPWEPTS